MTAQRVGRCSLDPSAHLAKAWADVGHSATLWSHKVGSVSSLGSQLMTSLESGMVMEERPG